VEDLTCTHVGKQTVSWISSVCEVSTVLPTLVIVFTRDELQENNKKLSKQKHYFQKIQHLTRSWLRHVCTRAHKPPCNTHRKPSATAQATQQLFTKRDWNCNKPLGYTSEPQHVYSSNFISDCRLAIMHFALMSKSITPECNKSHNKLVREGCWRLCIKAQSSRTPGPTCTQLG
jgi:hypothetical protein